MDKIKSVVLGHAVADALGVPVEFCSRGELEDKPVTEMLGFGSYSVPAGSWSDDTSMSLCALASLAKGTIDFDEIMQNFGKWYYNDEFTPSGEMFDVGNTCSSAIHNYHKENCSYKDCGLDDVRSNGNGSLMRIHPFVLFAHYKMMPLKDWEPMIFEASALTHAHERSKLACGIYAFILMHILAEQNINAVELALKRAALHYQDNEEYAHYARLFAADFAELDISEIRSSGYVVDTLEAAVWCLLTTNNYKDCVLKAVNLGSDTDTVAAIAGGLAGALYGYEAIPQEWKNTLIKREYIEAMCEQAHLSWRGE